MSVSSTAFVSFLFVMDLHFKRRLYPSPCDSPLLILIFMLILDLQLQLFVAYAVHEVIEPQLASVVAEAHRTASLVSKVSHQSSPIEMMSSLVANGDHICHFFFIYIIIIIIVIIIIISVATFIIILIIISA
jgi:hypothetical protein